MSPRPRHAPLRAAALAAGLALCLGPLVPAAASAAPGGTGVVIAEAYLRGGSANAPFSSKFVELYNPTSASVSLAGWSLQYRAAAAEAGALFAAAPLTGTIAAGGSFLVQLPGNGGATPVGAPLPTPDASVSLAPSGTTGTLVLSDGTERLALPTGSVPAGTPGVVDLLGYGQSLTFETAVAPVVGQNSTPNSLTRTAGADTDVNAADFRTATTITPQNAAGGSAPAPDPGPAPVPVPTADVTIAELQGVGAASPYVGRTVTTRGVVTATYPTGGLGGYVVQAPGTGGALDLATHVASDAVFVASPSTVSSVEIGDVVELVGTVEEAGQLTRLAVADASSVVQLDAAGVVAPVPATVGFPADAAQRESLESMLVLPQGDFTVTDTYGTARYGEVPLAAGTAPLLQPTEVARPGTPAAAAVVAENAARAVTLDDGSTLDYWGSGQSVPSAYVSNVDPVTVGAAVAFTAPVILDFGRGAWKYQPTRPVTGEVAYADLPVAFEDVRTDAPRDVGGDLSLASFNVLNYFTTTGDQLQGCTWFADRAGEPVTVQGGCDARGAADAADLARQQAKIVSAITALDADVVSLMEIENSAAFGDDRDAALGSLVAALDSAPGVLPGTWDFVPSPAVLPADEDVIRLGLIYKPAAVRPVGESSILVDDPAFDLAREPLAQAFRPVGGDASSDVLVIANHFKSKGSGSGADADQGDGQGASNATRVAEARALVAFADEREAAAGTDRVFLLGDFNAYTQEDPLEVLRAAGFTDLGSTETDEHSYVFSGLSGSLDHVLASPAALDVVTGVDIWNINSVESLGLEYSRFNYNVKQLYQADPFRSSDHDPVVVGMDLLADVAVPAPVPADPALPIAAAPAGPGAGAGAGAAPAGGALAYTGSDVVGWAALALALTAAGGALVVRRRRRAAGE